MGIVPDATAIQFRMLNRSKGPAVWSPRAQCDREKFIWKWRETLDSTPNLDIWQDQAEELIVEEDNGKKTTTGVKTIWGVTIKARCVVVTAGTFLNGLLHIGRKMLDGGRIAEHAVNHFKKSIRRERLPPVQLYRTTQGFEPTALLDLLHKQRSAQHTKKRTCRLSSLQRTNTKHRTKILSVYRNKTRYFPRQGTTPTLSRT